jgi:hypothetical protein
MEFKCRQCLGVLCAPPLIECPMTIEPRPRVGDATSDSEARELYEFRGDSGLGAQIDDA